MCPGKGFPAMPFTNVHGRRFGVNSPKFRSLGGVAFGNLQRDDSKVDWPVGREH